ncbi:MAG: hypothetical protein S4CHLAM102_01750 [Chlamydiia bacterium]|nr:hypothetical protein [Chlamydiia bacterium]
MHKPIAVFLIPLITLIHPVAAWADVQSPEMTAIVDNPALISPASTQPPAEGEPLPDNLDATPAPSSANNQPETAQGAPSDQEQELMEQAQEAGVEEISGYSQKISTPVFSSPPSEKKNVLAGTPSYVYVLLVSFATLIGGIFAVHSDMGDNYES